MHLKCQWCDTKRQELDKQNGVDIKANKESYKSINKETDSYVHVSNSYFHEDCYREKLTSGRKKYSQEEIDNKINELKVALDEKRLTDIVRDKFYEWIKNHYQVALPTNYVLRIDSIAKGQDRNKQVYGKITYDEFLEMYQKLALFLTKKTMNIQFKNTAQRMNYELAIVIGQYENYRNFKDNVSKREVLNKDVNNKLNDSNKYNEVSNKARQQEDDNLHIGDIIDELI